MRMSPLWPVARGPGAAPPDLLCANLGDAAVTRYISAGSGAAWRVQALVRSGAISPPSASHFSAWFGAVRPVCAQALAMRDNDEFAPAPSTIITHQTALKICTKSNT